MKWNVGTKISAGFGITLVIFVIVAQAAAVAVTHRPPPTLDWFATVSTVLIVAMFLWPPQFHYHFAAFFAPWLALAAGLPLAALVRDLRLISDGGDGATPPAVPAQATPQHAAQISADLPALGRLWIA